MADCTDDRYGLCFWRDIRERAQRELSKPSALENRYFDKLGADLRDHRVPSPIYPGLRAVERSHPRGVALWETGAGMKAHHFFAVGLMSLEAKSEAEIWIMVSA
jgi:hypothetical protein